MKIARSSPGVKTRMHYFELLPCDVGVYLSGCDIHMSQHHLDGSQICAAFEQVGRKGMSQAMGRHLFIQLRQSGVFAQQLPKPLPGDVPCRPGNKEIRTDLVF